MAAGADAEVAIVVLGERSGLTDDATTGEFRDRRTSGFIGRQQELLEAVVATGTPVVLVVVSGRPLAIEWAAAHCAAILLAWVPGDAGPEAIADVLDRRREPGRQAAGDGPARTSARSRSRIGTTRPAGARTGRATTSTARRRRSGRSASGCRTPTFEVDRLRVDRTGARRPTAARSWSASTCRTSATAAGDEVVQLYARDEEASVGPAGPASCAASAGSPSRPASAGRSSFDSRPSSSPTPAPTTGGSSSRADGVRSGPHRWTCRLSATVTLVGPTNRAARPPTVSDRNDSELSRTSPS